jgi:hypothetical protein
MSGDPVSAGAVSMKADMHNGGSRPILLICWLVTKNSSMAPHAGHDVYLSVYVLLANASHPAN